VLDGSHEPAAAILLLLAGGLLRPSGLGQVLCGRAGDGVVKLGLLLLVAEQHIVALLVLLALLLELFQIFLLRELRLLLDFVGEEVGAERVGFDSRQIIDEVPDFLVGGDMEGDFVEVQGVFFEEDH